MAVRPMSFPLHFAWRSLRRAPVFAITATLTLALGVGAVTAIFSVVNAVLIRPLPYPDADRLVGVGHAAPGLHMGEIGQSLGTYLTYERVLTTVESIGIWTRESVSLSDPAGGGEPERVPAVEIPPSMIPSGAGASALTHRSLGKRCRWTVGARR